MDQLFDRFKLDKSIDKNDKEETAHLEKLAADLRGRASTVIGDEEAGLQPVRERLATKRTNKQEEELTINRLVIRRNSP